MLKVKNSENSYVNIEDIKAKQGFSATEEQDIEFIKDKNGNLLYSKYNEIENASPVTFKSKNAALKNYRIYGNSKKVGDWVDGEKFTIGLQVDFKNQTFKRLENATGLNSGADFNQFSVYSGRKRCNVLDDGTISAFYGDEGYVEDGSNGQVMVYQPAFYYKVEPLKLEEQENGIGYHLRKVNYYISNYRADGFKLHPAFYNEKGEQINYILLGAYEGSLYDSSESQYVMDDAQVLNVDEDKFCSIANVKPASGLTQQLTRPNLETICKNRGDGWHSFNIKIASMEQLLMIIEFGTMNVQTGAGSDGVISIPDNSAYNCSSITGSTAGLGNASGQASGTYSDINGVRTLETENGKTSYSYRGVENPWGNIWKYVSGINVWGDGTMLGGVPFICKDYDFAESKRTDNYESAGFTISNTSGYVIAFGYSKDFDWLFMPSEIGGDSLLPVGDYVYVTTNLNGYRIARLGGSWAYGDYSGFYWGLAGNVGVRGRTFGGRLVYVPNSNSETGKYLVPVTVQGKNLLKNTMTSQSFSGVTFMANDDGSITCNGTAKGSIFIGIKNGLDFDNHILTGCPSGGSELTYWLSCDDSEGFHGKDTGNGVAISNIQNAMIAINIYEGYTCDNLTFYPMIRKADIIDDTYVPYIDPITTTIELETSLRKIGDESDYVDFRQQKQYRMRKNLLKNTGKSQTIGGVTFTANDDGSVTCNGTATRSAIYSLTPDGLDLPDSFLTGCPVNGGDDTYRINLFRGNGSSLVDSGNGIYIPEGNYWYAAIRIAKGYTCDNLTFYPMIRKADITDDTYEPYIDETEVPVSLPALPIISGTNILSVDTETSPSEVYLKGKISEVS